MRDARLRGSSLDNDVVIIAGATGRVGAATVGTVVTQGARVVVLSRSHESAQRLIDAQVDAALRDRAIAQRADLSDAASAQAAVDAVLARFGRVDAVVSLAGGGTSFVPLAASTAAGLETAFRNNLLVAYNITVPVLRAMLRQPFKDGARSRGRLVVVTAGSSRTPQPRFGLMGMGKAGVNVLMLAIAREHKADGIVANAVVLGTVATEPARDYLDDAEFAAAATPQEVADVLAFHASDASSGVNGSLIELNAREID
ncbi:MAG: SDR family NAD(P)-dependent oxidoreductase [Candidatus Velthaea sp.]